MIYQLKYSNKENAINNLIDLGVINNDFSYGFEVYAVVFIGKIVDSLATFDKKGNELTPPTYIDGYHVDVMMDKKVDFGKNLITPKKPRHKFFIKK